MRAVPSAMLPWTSPGCTGGVVSKTFARCSESVTAAPVGTCHISSENSS
jgi:hypothetical protein